MRRTSYLYVEWVIRIGGSVGGLEGGEPYAEPLCFCSGLRVHSADPTHLGSAASCFSLPAPSMRRASSSEIRSSATGPTEFSLSSRVSASAAMLLTDPEGRGFLWLFAFAGLFGLLGWGGAFVSKYFFHFWNVFEVNDWATLCEQAFFRFVCVSRVVSPWHSIGMRMRMDHQSIFRNS